MRLISILCLIFSCLTGFSVSLKLFPIVSEGLDNPVAVVPDPTSPTRYFVVEQRGRIQIVENGRVLRSLLLDIEDKVTSGGEMGLLGLALHPHFAENKRYFVNYTADRPRLTSVIAEYRIGRSEEKEILTFSQPYQNHNGGGLAFDQNGLLYIATGDGGSGGDPQGNGQSKKTLLGKMLRIDIDQGDRYGIPSDNPFVQESNVKKEIFAYGLRNPWRFSFDRVTGALFAGDVGQEKWEEVDIVEKGGNYGWNTMEGAHCYSPAVNCNQTGLIPPIWEYSHSQGNSITGGYVYRGKKIPELYGVYLYADYGSGKIWGLTYDQTAKKVIKNELLLNAHVPVSSFGEDKDGEILVVSYAGILFRLGLK